jgi:hypothetical protein
MKSLLLFSMLCVVLFIGNNIVCAENLIPKYPYPAIVGYWGVQATEQDCLGKVTPLTAVTAGYNVIILSFADIAGSGINPPGLGCLNFYKGGYADSGTRGAITFPGQVLQLSNKAAVYILSTVVKEIKELNNKGAVVLLSFGGAGATLPNPLPDPNDVYNAFVSFNDYLNKQAGTSRKQLVHGIDWDLENGVNSQKVVEWMASVSFIFKNNNLFVSCAPQSTNFNPTIGTWTSGCWNCYVPLVAAMTGNGTPIDAIMVQWYEPGGSHPAADVTAISNFVNQYYNTSWKVSFPTETLPGYKSTWPGIGSWLSKNKQKFIAGIGIGQGWGGVNNYTPKNLVSAFLKAGFGGFGIWDIEIDSGYCKSFALPGAPWQMVTGLKKAL